MTDPLGDLFTPTTRPTPTGARPKPCRRHDHQVWIPETDEWECQRCGHRVPVARMKLGRNNRKRGGAIQRKRIEGLGGQNLAGNNPNLDGIGARFRYESKSGGSFSERYWRWLKGIPTLAGQAGVLIVTDTPGPGHRARSIVIVDYDTWRDEHGEAKP